MNSTATLAAMTGSLHPRYAELATMRREVAHAFTVTEDDLASRTRTRGLVEARQALYVVVRRCTRLSLPEMAVVLNRDHSTIMSGIRAAGRLMGKDKWYQSTVDGLLALFEEKQP